MNSYIDDLTQKKHIHNAHIHILVSVSIFKSSGQHYIYFIIERFVVLLRWCWGRSVDFDCDGIYSLNVRLMLKYILDHFIERSHCHIFLDFIFLIVTERGVSTYLIDIGHIIFLILSMSITLLLQSHLILFYRHWTSFKKAPFFLNSKSLT
jgi:hypothetical protein